MILQVFAILDDKAGSYSAPFFMATRGQALRAFADLANDPQSTINKHPEDYRLHHIGTFDDNSGKLENRPEAFYLAQAADFVQTKGVPLSIARTETTGIDGMVIRREDRLG